VVAIVLPKHWRFNYPLLMGHLKKGAGGHLLRNAAHHLVNDCGGGGVCCDYLPSTITATLSGATGCAAYMNGTFVMNHVGSGCSYLYEEHPSAPGSPCDAMLACTTATIGGYTTYWYVDYIKVIATLSNTDASFSVAAQILWRAFYAPSGTCIVRSTYPGEYRTNDCTFSRATCRTGTLTRVLNQVNTGTFNIFGTNATTATCTY